MRRRSLLFVSAVLLVACGGSRPAAKSAAHPAEKPAVDAGAARGDGGTDARASSVDSRFTIVARGAAPRRVLDRAFRTGAEQRLDLSTVTRVMHKGSELAASVVEAPVDVHVGRVRADGAARFSATLGPFRYRTRGDPKLVQMMTQGAAKAGVLGDPIQGSGSMDVRGVIDDVKFQGPKKHPNPLTLALAASLMSSAEALPSGKFGAGARWNVHSSADVRGNHMDLVARYQIVTLGVKSARLRVQHEQPEFAPGDSADQPRLVKKSSEGEWVYYPDRVFPEGSEILRRPLPIPGTHDLELWSEVHLTGR